MCGLRTFSEVSQSTPPPHAQGTKFLGKILISPEHCRFPHTATMCWWILKSKLKHDVADRGRGLHGTKGILIGPSQPLLLKFFDILDRNLRRLRTRVGWHFPAAAGDLRVPIILSGDVFERAQACCGSDIIVKVEETKKRGSTGGDGGGDIKCTVSCFFVRGGLGGMGHL